MLGAGFEVVCLPARASSAFEPRPRTVEAYRRLPPDSGLLMVGAGDDPAAGGQAVPARPPRFPADLQRAPTTAQARRSRVGQQEALTPTPEATMQTPTRLPDRPAPADTTPRRWPRRWTPVPTTARRGRPHARAPPASSRLPASGRRAARRRPACLYQMTLVPTKEDAMRVLEVQPRRRRGHGRCGGG